MTQPRQALDAEGWRTRSYLVGHPLEQQRRYAEALAAYDHAIQIAPTDAEAYVNNGWALFTLSQLNDARRLLKQARRLRPDDADFLYRASCVEWDAWDYPQALRLAQQAIDLDTTQPRFYASLATTLSYLGREEEARQAEAQYQRMIAKPD